MKLTKLLLTLILIYLIPFYGCNRKPEYKKVRLNPVNPTVTSPKITNNDILKLVIAPVISSKSTIILYTDLVEYLRRQSGQQVRLLSKETYSEVNELLRHQECDVAFVCTGAYLRAKTEFPIELLAVPVVKGKTVYQSYIIVHKESKVKNLAQLKNQRFAFSDRLSLTGYLYLKQQLKQIRYTPESFFRKFIFTGSHDNSIKSVAAKITDAAAVDSIVYDTLIKQQDVYVFKTKIIAQSPEFGIPPVVINPGLPVTKKRLIRRILLTMHQHPQGKQALTKIGIDRFVTIGEENYRTAAQVLNDVGVTP